MDSITKEEKQFKIFMQVSGWTYFLVGFAFAFAPILILEEINIIADAVGGLPYPTHVQDGKPVGNFWLSLTFSMMMTITALCYFVQRNPRKNRSYAVPLMISKSVSALSAL
ncbi:MAG: hypothetical protein OEY64_12665, partial [Nitrospinota bacterium]|nr:hypothetical protein [Nitrospinota bacterium]